MTIKQSNMVFPSHGVFPSEVNNNSSYFGQMSPPAELTSHVSTPGNFPPSLHDTPDDPQVDGSNIQDLAKKEADVDKESDTGSNKEHKERSQSRSSSPVSDTTEPTSSGLSVGHSMNMPENELMGYQYPMDYNHGEQDGYNNAVGTFHIYNEYPGHHMPHTSSINPNLNESPTVDPPSPQTQYQYQTPEQESKHHGTPTLSTYINPEGHVTPAYELQHQNGAMVPYPTAESPFTTMQGGAQIVPYCVQQISYNSNTFSIDTNHRTHKQYPSTASTGSGSSHGNRSSFSHTRTSSSSTISTAPRIDERSQKPPLIKTAYWDDEKTLCYQVEVDGVLVSRREDTDYINGTKLLNVAGLSRGKRDGMLKSEKNKSIVKVGSMNLKGVWLPFVRACEIARNQGIDARLYPLLRKDLKEYFNGEGLHLKRGDPVPLNANEFSDTK